MTSLQADVRETNPWRERLLEWLNRESVQRLVIALILINAAVFGLETSDTVMAKAGIILHAIDIVILVIFVVEIALRLVASGWRFFRDPWAVFDLSVVLVALLPSTGSLSALRALRVMRVMRLISIIPSLRAVVGGLLRALPGLSSIALLLLVLTYVFAVIATNLYSNDSPEFFGTLGGSMLTLFQIMTLEGWADILRELMSAHPLAWLFFVVFILSTSFTMLNLFIGVIVEGMQAAREDQLDRLETGEQRVERELAALRTEVAALRQALEAGLTRR